MKHIYSIIIAAVVLVFSSQAFAYNWAVDKDHSEIRFEVTHILTGVSGRFNDFEGKIFFDPTRPETGKFDFTVKVDSVNTNNGKRDTHLRSKDFFNTSTFPDMKFKSTGISHVQGDRYALEGKMTIKGVSKDIHIEFRFLEPKSHPFEKKKKVAGFITRFSLNRLDYSVGNGKFLEMGVVGKEVDVEIAMEALTDK